MVVFSLFLGRVAAEASSDVPYPLFVLTGLVPWTFFSNAMSSAGQSVVGNQNLVTKVYFPRLFIPMGAVGAGAVDFVISFGLVLLAMLFLGMLPGWNILLVPLLFLGLMVAALGVGTLLSALTVAYRDFRYVVPFMVQLWMFATPSIYLQATSEIGSLGHLLLPLNPAYGLIANFRVAVLGGSIDLYSLAVSGAVSLIFLTVGCLYFRRVERGFADII
jgi:lipopolysaccharide transport system permease protein